MNNDAKKSGTAKRRSTEISCVPGRDGTGINTRRREFTMPWKSNICRRGACAATAARRSLRLFVRPRRNSARSSSASSRPSDSKSPDPNPNSDASISKRACRAASTSARRNGFNSPPDSMGGERAIVSPLTRANRSERLKNKLTIRTSTSLLPTSYGI